MKWIGLTGGIGSGKSTIAQILRKKGWPVIDADTLSREVIQKGTKGLDQVIEVFGKDIIDPETGEVHRQKMAELVFSNPQKLAELESIIHPLVRAAAAAQRSQLENSGHEMAFYDVPLLFEKDMKELFDKIVLVFAEEHQQIDRTQKRDNINKEKILKRIKTQIPMSKKLKMADIIIDNKGEISDLASQVDKLISELI